MDNPSNATIQLQLYIYDMITNNQTSPKHKYILPNIVYYFIVKDNNVSNIDICNYIYINST